MLIACSFVRQQCCVGENQLLVCAERTHIHLCNYRCEEPTAATHLWWIVSGPPSTYTVLDGAALRQLYCRRCYSTDLLMVVYVDLGVVLDVYECVRSSMYRADGVTQLLRVCRVMKRNTASQASTFIPRPASTYHWPPTTSGDETRSLQLMSSWFSLRNVTVNWIVYATVTAIYTCLSIPSDDFKRHLLTVHYYAK